jgi:hypothetical protein
MKHTIEISPTANKGYIVKVGCCTLCYSTLNDMLDDLGEYFKDPEKVEAEYNKFSEDEHPPLIEQDMSSR